MIVNEGGGGGKKLPTLTNPGAAGDMLSGKQLLNQEGEVVTGTIPSKTDADISVSGRTVTVPAGHYGTQASKSVATVTQATPSVTVSNTGLITAVAQQNAGYVEAGSKSATHQLTTQGGKTVTPGTSQQTAVASGRYTTGPVYVAGSANLKAENIKQGVNIFGVVGTLQGAGERTEFGFLVERPTHGRMWIYTDISYTEQPEGKTSYFVNDGDSSAHTFECRVGSFVIIESDDRYNDDNIARRDLVNFEEIAVAGNAGGASDRAVYVYLCTGPNGIIRVNSR